MWFVDAGPGIALALFISWPTRGSVTIQTYQQPAGRPKDSLYCGYGEDTTTRERMPP
jgi:hypothetical protein